MPFCETTTTTTTLPSILEQIEGEPKSCTSVRDCPSDFCRGENIEKYSCTNGECTAILEPCPIGSVCREVRIWDELQGYYNKPKCVPVDETEIDLGLGYQIIPELDDEDMLLPGGGMVEIKTTTSKTTISTTFKQTTTTVRIAGPDFDPIFKHNWDMPPNVDYDYNALAAMTPDQIRALGKPGEYSGLQLLYRFKCSKPKLLYSISLRTANFKSAC